MQCPLLEGSWPYLANGRWFTLWICNHKKMQWVIVINIYSQYLGTSHQHPQSENSCCYPKEDWSKGTNWILFHYRLHYPYVLGQILLQSMHCCMQQLLINKVQRLILWIRSKIMWCLTVPVKGYPSWLHTTLASMEFQPSPHTVPHWSLIQISTRPSNWSEPPMSLISPVLHTSPWSMTVLQYRRKTSERNAFIRLLIYVCMMNGHCIGIHTLPGHLTPASSWCPQSCIPTPLWEQSNREDSDPLQKTLSRSIAPVPAPYVALSNAKAPARESKSATKLNYWCNKQ